MGRPRDEPDAARSVTHDTGRGIRFYLWAYTNTHILYLQDKNGPDHWRSAGFALQNGEIQELTPIHQVQAQIIASSHKIPEEIVIAINNRLPEWHDVYRLHINTSAMSLIQQNDGFAEFTLDDEYRLRIAAKMTPDGGIDIYQWLGDSWELWENIPPQDLLTTGFVGFDKTNQRIYMKDSRGLNTSALVEKDLATRQ